MRALLQRHDRPDALIAATASVFRVNKADGQPSGRPPWTALTGQSHAEMQGLGRLDAVHSGGRPRTLAAWTRAIEHAAPYNTDDRAPCADGIYRWLNARGAPVLDRDGSTREWVGVCLNVSGRTRYGAPPPETPAPAPSVASSADTHVTPAQQIRVARGKAGLSQEDLAKLADVSISTVAGREDSGSAVRPRPDTDLAVRRALEKAGIVFTFEPGLREA